jgi:hypothetical protein
LLELTLCNPGFDRFLQFSQTRQFATVLIWFGWFKLFRHEVTRRFGAGWLHGLAGLALFPSLSLQLELKSLQQPTEIP